MLRSIDVIIFQSDIIHKRIEKSLENWKLNSLIRLLSSHLITVFTSITAYDRFSYNGFKLWYAQLIMHSTMTEIANKQTRYVFVRIVFEAVILSKSNIMPCAMCIQLCIWQRQKRSRWKRFAMCTVGLISRFISNSLLIWPFQQTIPSLDCIKWNNYPKNRQ